MLTLTKKNQVNKENMKREAARRLRRIGVRYDIMKGDTHRRLGYSDFRSYIYYYGKNTLSKHEINFVNNMARHFTLDTDNFIYRIIGTDDEKGHPIFYILFVERDSEQRRISQKINMLHPNIVRAAVYRNEPEPWNDAEYIWFDTKTNKEVDDCLMFIRSKEDDKVYIRPIPCVARYLFEEEVHD